MFDGLKLKEYLKTNDITFKTFANELKIGKQKLNYILNNIQVPEDELIEKIYNVLNLPKDNFETNESLIDDDIKELKDLINSTHLPVDFLANVTTLNFTILKGIMTNSNIYLNEDMKKIIKDRLNKYLSNPDEIIKETNKNIINKVINTKKPIIKRISNKNQKKCTLDCEISEMLYNKLQKIIHDDFKNDVSFAISSILYSYINKEET